jgi:hypothetical protein
LLNLVWLQPLKVAVDGIDRPLRSPTIARSIDRIVVERILAMARFEKPSVSDYTLLSLGAGGHHRLKALWFLEMTARSQHFFMVKSSHS